MSKQKTVLDPRRVVAGLWPDWKERFAVHFDMIRELMRQQGCEAVPAGRRLSGIATGIDPQTAMILLAAADEIAEERK